MRLFLFSQLLTVSTPLNAHATIEDFDQLERRIVETIGQAITPIDRRIQLTKCPAPATIDNPALGAVAVRCPALGWRVRVRLDVDNAMRDADVRIHRGDAVAIAFRGDGFQLRTTATALEDAAQGRIIHVKSSTGGVILVARVTGVGEAQIGD